MQAPFGLIDLYLVEQDQSNFFGKIVHASNAAHMNLIFSLPKSFQYNISCCEPVAATGGITMVNRMRHFDH